MSRAAIIIALTRVYQRTPTRAEYEDFCRDLGPGTVMYVPQTWPAMSELAPEVQRLRGEGKSIRHIARTLKLSKSAVHRMLSQNCLCLVDTEAA